MARVVATGSAGPEFDFGKLPAKVVRSHDRISQIALLGAQATLENYRGNAAPKNIGMIMGLDQGAYPTVAVCLERTARDGYRQTSPKEFALATPNIAHSLTCIKLGLKGANTNLSSGSISSLAAIGLASDLIEWERARTLLTGGATCTDEPIPRLAEAFGIRKPVERSAFVILDREGSDIDVSGFRQRRVRKSSMAHLIRETIGDSPVDAAIIHPGPRDKMDGLPDVPIHDIRELAGESLDASGAVAVLHAIRRVEAGNRAVLVAQRDLGGHDGAALLVTRIS